VRGPSSGIPAAAGRFCWSVLAPDQVDPMSDGRTDDSARAQCPSSRISLVVQPSSGELPSLITGKRPGIPGKERRRVGGIQLDTAPYSGLARQTRSSESRSSGRGERHLETTSICVVDDAGAPIWRGKCSSDPAAAKRAAPRSSGGNAEPFCPKSTASFGFRPNPEHRERSCYPDCAERPARRDEPNPPSPDPGARSNPSWPQAVAVSSYLARIEGWVIQYV
jgi:hypothetical protein